MLLQYLYRKNQNTGGKQRNSGFFPATCVNKKSEMEHE